MLRERDEVAIERPDDGVCDVDCGCAPGSCAASAFLPAYQPDQFKRNVTALNHALENFSFAIGVAARLTEEAFLIQDEAL